MGRAARLRPFRLAEKLLQIRHDLGLSQNEMLSRLGFADQFTRTYISGFESGLREPPLPMLLAYARIASISTDVLINDELDLPQQRQGIKKR